MLGHAVLGIPAHVGHRDAALAARVDVYAVMARGGNRHQPQGRHGMEDLPRQAQLVRNGNRGAGQASGHLLDRRGVMLDPLMHKGGASQADARVQGGTLQVDDAVGAQGGM